MAIAACALKIFCLILPIPPVYRVNNRNLHMLMQNHSAVLSVLVSCMLAPWIGSAQSAGNIGKPPFPDWVPFDGSAFEFLEGVAVDKTGNVFVSLRASPVGPLPFPDQLWKISPSGEKCKYAEFSLPGGGGCGLAVDAVGNVFMARNSELGRGVYRVDRDRNVALLPGTEQIAFPDGLAFDQRGNLYITESFSLAASEPHGFGQGGIWRVAKGGGTAELWLRDELLTGVYPPLLFTFPVGANGIIYCHGALYVNNTDARTVVRVPVRPNGSPGEPTVWARIDSAPGLIQDLVGDNPGLPVMLDGISADVHGNLYVAVPTRAAIVRINAIDRSQETVAAYPDFPLDAPVSLAFGTGKGDRQSLLVTNLGYSALFLPALPWSGPALVKIDIGIPGLPLP